MESSLYYLNTRYYDPQIGRFINADEITILDETQSDIHGLNLYMYCNNNPVMMADPSGRKPKWWQWVLFGIGAALVVAAAVVAIVATGGAATGVIGAIAIGAAKGAVIGAVVGSAVGIAGGAIYAGVTGADMGESILSGFLIGFGVGAIAGAVIGGAVGGLAPRITAYKNVGSYKFSGKLSNPDHLARSYQHSTLLQKQIIKNGKMVREGKGIYKFIAKGTVSIGAGSIHTGEWKLVVDVLRKIMLHMGPRW